MSKICLPLLILLSVAVSSASDLDQHLDRTFKNYEKARVVLMERVRAFNQGERELRALEDQFSDPDKLKLSLMSPLSLQWSSGDRDELLKAQLENDRRKFSAILKSQLLQHFRKTKFNREEWEGLISENIPQDVVRDLEQTLARIENESFLNAQKESARIGIDLRRLSKDSAKTQQFCREIPKGGMLHTHPYGTLDRQTVRDVLETFNPIVKKEELLKYTLAKTEQIHPEELHFLNERSEYYHQPQAYLDILRAYPQDAVALQNLFFMPKDRSLYNGDFTPFRRFLGAFAAPLHLLGILTGRSDVQMELEKMIYDRFFVRNLEQGVNYAELTRNLPVLLHSRSFEERYEELLRWTQDVENRSSAFYPKTLYSFNRTNLDTDDKQLQQVQVLSDLLSMPKSSAVVGINLMGDESQRSALDSAQFIYGKLLVASPSADFSQFHLKPSIHAGELGDVRNLRDAVIFGVRRVGHGVLFLKNLVYLEYARRNQLAIETNLTSNVVLQVSGVKENPFLYFQRLGLKVSLSTDDEGIFETDMNNECVLAIVNTNIEYSELKQMMVHSIETSFADRTTRERLREKLLQDFKAFEVRWASH